MWLNDSNKNTCDMATTNIIELVKKNCKLYKGGDTNPYRPEEASKENWAKEYLKFQIWDAEYSVVQKFTWWRQMWEDSHFIHDLSKEERAEEIYKLAIKDKLRKIEREDIDFMQMYFDL